MTTYIVDFDSTVVRVEALELLSEIVLQGDPEASAKLAAIAVLTDRAMTGEMSFAVSLTRRVAMLRPTRANLAAAVERLHQAITPSVREHAGFFGSEDVYVVSGGFHEMIDPVVADLGVPPERVLANTFVFDDQGFATGPDRDNPLARDGGKAEAVRSLDRSGDIVVAVGDGWTDYEIRAAGAAHRFYAFVENVERPRVVAHADRVARSFGDLLRQEGLMGLRP